MTVAVDTPSIIYRKISQEVERILSSLTGSASDEKLQEANDSARQQLEAFQHILDQNISSLEKNAEWNTFTIAFYGETNAGKSTLIETLRILLNEESKTQRQQAFRQFQQQHNLTDEHLAQLNLALSEHEKKTAEITQAIEAINAGYVERETEFARHIASLNALIMAQRQQSSLWKKFINLWVKTPTQKERASQLIHQQALAIEKSQALSELLQKQKKYEAEAAAIKQQQTAAHNKLAELAPLADGEIIGDGRSDFTIDTTHYAFEANQQRFALLDVPGIEGKEEKVSAQIHQAVQKAHAVFYVTSKATAPQKGDENAPGTLEKIKAHLNAQTEVWTLFNKRITNPMQLNRPALLTDDEKTSLEDLNDKMREQLGDNYSNAYSLSAMPAFLSVAAHLVPGSENAKKREKLLEKLTTEDVLEKTGLADFMTLLTEQLVANNKEKIARSNFNKARTTVEELTAEVAVLQKGTYSKLAAKLQDDTLNASQQLDMALAALKTRLINLGEEAVDAFRSKARQQIYSEIEYDISNDRFKDELESCIRQQHAELETKLPALLKRELDGFKDEIESIVRRFQEYAKEILATYSRLQQSKFDTDFELKINIDNGVKLTSLLATLAGGALLFWNPAGWLVLAPALAGMVFAVYKAVRSFFSSNYKMSQQRQSADENLSKVARKMKSSLEDGIEKVFPELQEKITELKSMLDEPARQASQINRILINATAELSQLSNSLIPSGAK